MSNLTVSLDDSNFESVTSQGLPVLVDFYADWCGPCKALTPVVTELASEFEGRAVIAKVNVDDAPALAGRFGVRSIPTIVLLKDGEETDRVVGLASKKVLAAKLESA